MGVGCTFDKCNKIGLALTFVRAYSKDYLAIFTPLRKTNINKNPSRRKDLSVL